MAIDPSKLVGVGTTANDNTGDPLRDAFVKINDNFTELYIEPSISLVGNTLTLTRPDDSTSTVDLAPYIDDTNLITSVDGGTGLEVDTTTGDVTVSVSDNGIDHQQLSNSYTALSDLGTGSSFAIDFDSASTFTATANAAATLTMSNAQQGQVVDIIMGVGDFAITLAETGSTFNKVGTAVYDGTTNNIIQIICTDDTSGSKIYHYAVSTYTAGATV